MQRRDLIASLALFFVSFRNGFSLSKSSTTEMNNTEIQNATVKLKHNFTFELPTSPKNGLTVYFLPEHDLKLNPSFITAAKPHNIMGNSEPLEIDENIPFALTFNSEYQSWILSTQTIESDTNNQKLA